MLDSIAMPCAIERLIMAERSFKEDAAIECYPSGAVFVKGSDTKNNHNYGAASIDNNEQQHGAASLNGHHRYGSGSTNEQENDNNEPNTPNMDNENYPGRLWNYSTLGWDMLTSDIGQHITQRTHNNQFESQRMQQFFENEIGNGNVPGAANPVENLPNAEGVDPLHVNNGKKQVVYPLDVEPNNPYNYGHILEVDGDNNDHFNFNLNNANDSHIPYTSESENANRNRNTQSHKRKRSELSTSVDDSDEELNAQIQRRAFDHTIASAELVHTLRQVLATTKEEITQLDNQLAACDKKYARGYLSKEKCAYLYPKDRNHHSKHEQTYVRDANIILDDIYYAEQEYKDLIADIKNAILNAVITDELLERFKREIQEEERRLEADNADNTDESYDTEEELEEESLGMVYTEAEMRQLLRF